MKKILLSLLIASPLLLTAQKRNELRRSRDSASYYQGQASQLVRTAIDSIQQSEAYKELMEKAARFRKKSNNYGGFVFLADVFHSNYDKFNASIAQNGFDPLNPISARIGIGISNKSDGILFDMYFFAGGIENKSKKGNEKISASASNALVCDLGIDLLHSRVLSLYPYAGLSLRFSSLDYTKPVQVNNSFTNITDIIINDQTVRASSTKIGYQAGLGLDVIVSNPGKGEGVIALFAKAGTASAFGKEKYKIEGIKYDPAIKHGDWLVTFGVKMAGRY